MVAQRLRRLIALRAKSELAPESLSVHSQLQMVNARYHQHGIGIQVGLEVEALLLQLQGHVNNVVMSCRIRKGKDPEFKPIRASGTAWK